MGWQYSGKGAGEMALVGNWRYSCGNVQGLQRDRCLQCNAPYWKGDWTIVRTGKVHWGTGPKRSAWDQGPPHTLVQSQKAQVGQEPHHRDKVTIQTEPEVLLKLLLETLQKDDEHKDTIAALKLVMDKKKK